MSNKAIIEKFYTSFSKGDPEGMICCYHKDITFQDPVFGKLHGKRAMKMWEMLMSKRTESTKVRFENIQANDEKGQATWIAEYNFGEKQRRVINVVHASFTFKDGLIFEHTDYFDIWKWSSQALGIGGLLMGWTPFMKTKIQKTTTEQLERFMNKK